MELDVTGKEVANGEGWEEGECVGRLDVTVGVRREIFTLNVHTKPVGQQKICYCTYVVVFTY